MLDTILDSVELAVVMKRLLVKKVIGMPGKLLRLVGFTPGMEQVDITYTYDGRRVGMATAAIAALLIAVPMFAATPGEIEDMRKRNDSLLQKIRSVETGGSRNPDTAVGDHGLAVGAYQLHPNFVKDAQDESPWLPDMRSIRTTRREGAKAVCAYWAKYRCTDDAEKALVFHYGPSRRKGASKEGQDPDGYLKKVGVK